MQGRSYEVEDNNGNKSTHVYNVAIGPNGKYDGEDNKMRVIDANDKFIVYDDGSVKANRW